MNGVFASINILLNWTECATFKFVGTTCCTNVTNDFLLNNEGNGFEKATTTLAPFRACFRTVGYTSGSVLPILSEGSQPTGIDGVPTLQEEQPSAVFSLQGIRQQGLKHTLPKGIYVVKGKKYVK